MSTRGGVESSENKTNFRFVLSACDILPDSALEVLGLGQGRQFISASHFCTGTWGVWKRRGWCGRPGVGLGYSGGLRAPWCRGTSGGIWKHPGWCVSTLGCVGAPGWFGDLGWVPDGVGRGRTGRTGSDGVDGVGRGGRGRTGSDGVGLGRTGHSSFSIQYSEVVAEIDSAV